MDKELELLIKLHDLDMMIRDASEERFASEEEGLGFVFRNLESLREARASLRNQISEARLNHYDRQKVLDLFRELRQVRTGDRACQQWRLLWMLPPAPDPVRAGVQRERERGGLPEVQEIPLLVVRRFAPLRGRPG